MITAPPLLDTSERFAHRKRWTRDDCAFLERVGMLPERYELIGGQIIEKSGQNTPHAVSVMRALMWLTGAFGGDYMLAQAIMEVSEQDQPINRPEPDVIVLKRRNFEYSERPKGSDLRLAIEVSDSTLRGYLEIKARLYARAEVPEYWVLDVPSRRLFVHRKPENGSYAEVTVATETETISPLAAPDRRVQITELLAPV